MKLSQQLSRRLGIATTIILLIFLIVAISETLLSINREKFAISNLLTLSSTIESLKTTSASEFPERLNQVIHFSQHQEFRHVQIRISDSSGQLLAENDLRSDINPIGLLIGKTIYGLNAQTSETEFKKSSVIQGVLFEIIPDPISEQSEAGTNLLISISTLVGFAIILYLGLKLILYKALHPLHAAIEQLQKLALNQYDGILTSSDTLEVRRINQAINDLSTSLIHLEKSRQLLSAKIISAQEDERVNISRELHDEFGQKIAVIRLNTGYLGKVLGDYPGAMQALTDINQAIKDIDGELKSLLKRLKADQSFLNLKGKSLSELLIELIQEWQKSPSQLTQFNYAIDLPNEGLSSNLCLTLFRITQEALTNIAKHARATRVDIKINRDQRYVYWLISDNGQGLSQDLTTTLLKGNGLSGLQERIWSIGGELYVNQHNEDNKGFILEAKIPLSN